MQQKTQKGKKVLILIGIIFITTLLFIIIYSKKNYMNFFINEKTEVIETKENLLQSPDESFFSELYFKDNKNIEYDCYMRKPGRFDGKKIPALILLGGMVTGKEVINLVADIEAINQVVIVSMEYPYTGKKKFKNGLEMIYHYPEIRAGLNHSIWGIMHIVDYLYKHPWIDKERIFLAGASFGAFFAIIAGAAEERIAAVLTCYGGGDLMGLTAYNLHFKPAFVNELLARFFYLFVAPYEPLKYVDGISPRPFLMINGKEDEQIPGESVTKLFEKAGEPKELIWFETKHIRPTQNTLTLELTTAIAQWLKKNNLLD